MEKCGFGQTAEGQEREASSRFSRLRPKYLRTLSISTPEFDFVFVF